MENEPLLSQIGLSQAEANDLVTKFTSFYYSLSAAQKAVFDAGRPSLSAAQAAAALGAGVSVDDLHGFVSSVTGQPGASASFLLTSPQP
jgi:hypothetical protein